MGKDCASTLHVRHRTLRPRRVRGTLPSNIEPLPRLARCATRRIAHARHGRGCRGPLLQRTAASPPAALDRDTKRAAILVGAAGADRYDNPRVWL